ncbi:glycosyltransferase family 4 protein [Pararhodonellum marinum]|uniref:glycosyltransferase family 4 protein n=1 Tax=Pararhodonellum marinum TaxID=2755358 RepID=UPI00188DCA55|nr:glycosyltransferase family 4 protein [Pararhodonellum marinum]
MDLIFNPPVNKANQYISILVNGLEEAGFKVHPLDGIFSGYRHFKSIRLVHLNWFENLDETSYIKMLISFFRKSIVLTVIRLSNKKLVWTMHNRVSHEKKSNRLSKILTHNLIKFADAIIIHSHQSRDLILESHPSQASKIHYIPHPDFTEIYGPEVEKKNSSNGKLKLLFLGAVKPYKNLELLIRTAGQMEDKLQLSIAGNPTTENYKAHLTRFAAVFNNIKLKLEFIPDSDIPNLLGESDLLILPYDLNSSLNSGTVLLAFSYRKTGIFPQIGTLTDMTAMQDQFLSYHYTSDEEHASKLREMLESAFQLKKNNPEVFQMMGNKMFHYVKQNHGKKMVIEKLKQVYQSVLHS